MSGLDTKVNLRVSLLTDIMNLTLLKQQTNETNEAYHTKFKSMIEPLKITGGEHLLASPMMIGMELDKVTNIQIREEKETFIAICLILRSDVDRYKRLLEDLKRSVNLGRDKYPESLTEAFDLLVRESGKYNTVLPSGSNIYHGRGRRGGRGRQSFLFNQQCCGGQGTENISYLRTNDYSSDEVVAGTDGKTFSNIDRFGYNFTWVLL